MATVNIEKKYFQKNLDNLPTDKGSDKEYWDAKKSIIRKEGNSWPNSLVLIKKIKMGKKEQDIVRTIDYQPWSFLSGANEQNTHQVW